MSDPDDAAFEEFVSNQRPKLIMSLAGQGWSLSDVEDAFQVVSLRMFARKIKVGKLYSYFYSAMRNELVATAKRQRGDLARAGKWAAQQGVPTVNDVYHLGEGGPVREHLSILPTRQRAAATGVYGGYRPEEIAEELAVPASTVRSNLRHARKTLEPFAFGDGHEYRRWLRSSEQVHEAFFRGDSLPLAPRPVISHAWQAAKDLGVGPDRVATGLEPLDQEEIVRRRRQTPVPAHPWVLNDLIELAKDTGQMMVVADADRTVLWRGGASTVLEAADSLGFVEGAYWDMKRAGVNGIELASRTGTTVTVSRFEHSCVSQHKLSCLSAPVIDPRDGRLLCVLNLTGTEITIHHAVQRAVDTIAFRLRQQLRTV